MNRYAISGLVVTVTVLAGCAPTSKTALDPDVEMVLPAPNTVTYVPPPTAVTAPAAPTTVVAVPATGSTTVVQTSPAGVAVVPAPAPPPSTIVVVPAPSGVATVMAADQTLRAGDITGERVRANTIYANRIDADEVRGVIHQDRNLQIGSAPRGDVRMPDVVASVIYADQITANSIIAEHIYVRDLRRR